MKNLNNTAKNLQITSCHSESFSQYEGEDQVVTSLELYDKLQADKREPHVNVKSGIPGIDYACEGFRDGELIIISGPTKMGKTLLAQTFTANFTKQKEYACWFSYEVPARQFLEQFPILPLFYLPSKNTAQDFNWFMDRCMEAYFKYNARIFFVDHLHFLVDMARVNNPSLEIGAIVRRIKRFAVENDFIIFLLAHIKKNEGEDLSYRDLRDSSFIAQDSDTVIMIKRTPKAGQNVAKARVEFHRRTGIMEWVVNLEKQHGYLREIITEDENE
jgi:replicative DNA helicase